MLKENALVRNNAFKINFLIFYLILIKLVPYCSGRTSFKMHCTSTLPFPLKCLCCCTITKVISIINIIHTNICLNVCQNLPDTFFLMCLYNHVIFMKGHDCKSISHMYFLPEYSILFPWFILKILLLNLLIYPTQ